MARYSDSGNFPGSNPTRLPRFQQHLAEQKSWQAPKYAKNPLTQTMILAMARTTCMAHQDSDSAAIYDWMVLGLSTGARWVEYAQTSRTQIDMVWVCGYNSTNNNHHQHNPMRLLMGISHFLIKTANRYTGRRALIQHLCASAGEHKRTKTMAKQSCSR